jgi:hypothetical protein
MKLKFRVGIPGGPEGSHSFFTHNDVAPSDTGQPVTRFAGFQPATSINAVVPGGSSYQIDPSPVTVARYNMSRGVHDVQLSNGWQRTNYGKVTTYGSSGYLSSVVPTWPGQTRLIGQGGSPANYTPRTQSAIAPSGWNAKTAAAQNLSVNTISGPGTVGGPMGYMGQSGG